MRYATQTQMAMFPEIVSIAPMDWKNKHENSMWFVECEFVHFWKSVSIEFKLWYRLFHFKTFIVSYSHLFRGESLKAGNNNICVQFSVNICSPHRFIFVCKGCKSLYTVAAYEQFWRETTWKKNRKFFFPQIFAGSLLRSHQQHLLRSKCWL